MENTILKIRRESKGLSQKALANALNVKQSMISRWENNLCIPDPQNLAKIAQFLEMDLPEVYNYFDLKYWGCK